MPALPTSASSVTAWTNWWEKAPGTFLHPEDLARVQAATRNISSTAIEYRFRHKDGTFRTLESFGRDLSHLAGVGGVVVNSRDVTERRRLEDQLHHSQRIEAMGRLAGGVAHDFNNLLMVIAGHSQMLLDSMLPGDPARDDLEQVVKAAERATDLTRQLLAFSRRHTVKPALLDLNILVQQMERMLRRVLGENILFVTVLAAAPDSVYADPGQIEQVILNLILNARDAMPQGGTLTLQTSSALSESNSGRSIVLSVSDTGAGIDSEVLAHVFEPFFTTKEHGTGLGLSTSYGIIKQAGGEIEVDSKPGGGTTFRIIVTRGGKDRRTRGTVARERSPAWHARPSCWWKMKRACAAFSRQCSKRTGYRVLSSGICFRCHDSRTATRADPFIF